MSSEKVDANIVTINVINITNVCINAVSYIIDSIMHYSFDPTRHRARVALLLAILLSGCGGRAGN